MASPTSFHPSGGWISSFDDELDEIVEEEIALIDFFAETRDEAVAVTTTTTTTTVAPIIKIEQIEPDWNDVHQQGEELQMRPYQRRFEHRPLETRVLLLDSDLENRLQGEERTIGREIAIKKEPLSEEEEEMGIYWEDAHLMSVKDLKSRSNSSLPDNIRKQGKKIIIDGEEPSLSSSSLSERLSELESSEKEEENVEEEVEEEEEQDDKEKDGDFRIEEVEEDEDDEEEEEKGNERRRKSGKNEEEKDEEGEQEKEGENEESEEERGNEEEENKKEEEEEEKENDEGEGEDRKEEGNDDDSEEEEEEGEEKEKEEEEEKKEENSSDEEEKESDDEKSSKGENKTSRSVSLEVSSKSSDESEYSDSTEKLGMLRDGEEEDSEDSDEEWELSSSRAARLAAKPKRALAVQTRRSVKQAASVATTTAKRTDSMEKPASELMDSRSESLDVGVEETGIPQSPPIISRVEEDEEENERDHPVSSTTSTTTVAPPETSPSAIRGFLREVEDTQASSYSDSIPLSMSSAIPIISTNDTVSNPTLSTFASSSSASMNITHPDFDSLTICDWIDDHQSPAFVEYI